MNKITQWLARWFAQPDKVLHVIVGALAFNALVLASRSLPMPGALRTSALLALVALAAWAKERYDKAHPTAHTADGWDAFATVAGGLAAALAWALAAAGGA